MQKSTLPQGVKTLMSWADKETLTFDNPVQRAGSQWNLLQKSLLIHSMLANYPVPAVYLLKYKDDAKGTIYDCLDAKQRLTSVFDFIRGEYELSSATPEVEVDGTVYDLANMKFDDLSDECKDAITGYRFSVYCLEDATDEEVEEVFRRLNNSTPLSPIQKCRSVMGTDIARWTKEICQSEFLQHSVSLTLAQLRREADLEVLLQSMLLLDARHEGYDDWKAISTAEVTKYCTHIRGTYNDDKRLMVMEIVDYLYKAFPEKHKFLKKSNIPMVMVLSKLALENNISPEDFKEFVDFFSEDRSEEYMAGMGSGNVKRFKTEMRLTAIANAFADYFNLNDVRVLSVDETMRSVADNSENSDAFDESDENLELITETSSVEEQDESGVDFVDAEQESAVASSEEDSDGEDD